MMGGHFIEKCQVCGVVMNQWSQYRHPAPGKAVRWGTCPKCSDGETTPAKDRHYICLMGKLFWGDDKQCYAADAVYWQIVALLKRQEEDV